MHADEVFKKTRIVSVHVQFVVVQQAAVHSICTIKLILILLVKVTASITLITVDQQNCFYLIFVFDETDTSADTRSARRREQELFSGMKKIGAKGSGAKLQIICRDKLFLPQI